MRGLKVLLCAVTVLVSLTLMPKAQAQVAISIGGPPPVCTYGYYDYAPYACAPYGFYGPGYFYNGIFLGVGPWRNWGYQHGWGRHRFNGARGGHYRPGMRPGHGYRPPNNGRPSHGGGRPSHGGGNGRPSHGGGHGGNHGPR